MKARMIAITACLLLLAPLVPAQRSEVTISLSEQFFDALVDSIYKNSPPPEFQLADSPSARQSRPVNALTAASDVCSGSVTLLRENRSMRTAVRFRDGKIYAPVAFTGNYEPPLIGCVDFSGYAETLVQLEFDPASQKLLGRIKVVNVNLDGTAGIGGSLIARIVQGSIDKKLNPIEVVSLDKLSFPFTLPNSAKLKMRATAVRHEVTSGALNIIISYEFVKD